VHSALVPDCGLNVSRAITPAAIATTGMCLLFARVLFELDDFGLGLGAGLVTGNLSSWVTAPMGATRGEQVQRWLLWALVGGVGLSFVLFHSALLTFFLFGACSRSGFITSSIAINRPWGHIRESNELLGVSKQRAHQIADEPSFPAPVSATAGAACGASARSRRGRRHGERRAPWC
jgi:hypothetical protein